ncbi:MAG: sigma 54-interacting transcriptional regulator [Deltaproteobacteria bacterium]|nr:sigma 54-interacting transcriptional regulator [Deltaproteobacteria bacterium]
MVNIHFSEETAHIEEPSIRLVSLKENSNRLTTETLKLEIREPSGKNRQVLMDHSPFRIGKGDHNDVMIDDPYVSDQHCKIRLVEKGWLLKDMASTNGTYLNGKKVEEGFVESGDKLQVGQSEICLQVVKKEETVLPEKEEEFCGLIGGSEKMRQLYALLRRVGPADASVLIQGETGSGKELVARGIHQLSPFAGGPFVAINCGAISPELIESELFGHEKGAFTGAVASRKGAFEAAEKGTLFLDEVGELPLRLQPKLLRVLEQKAVKRVGGNQEIPVSTRVIAATHKNLKTEVKKGNFREDLFFRLHIVPLFIPSLRERREDIPLLTDHFLKELGHSKIRISEKAKLKLSNYDWPGNVRELKHLLTRACLLAKGGPPRGESPKGGSPRGDSSKGNRIEEEDLQFSDGESAAGPTSLESAEKETILSKLNQSGWNKTQTAQALGIAKSTLFKKIREYNLKP